MCKDLSERYMKETTLQVKYLDVFISFAATTAFLQAVYCFIVGTYPFNSFLSGFIISLGTCVLSSIAFFHFALHVVCFRMGITSKEFETVSNNRVFAEYCFCMLLLFLVVCNYLG